MEIELHGVTDAVDDQKYEEVLKISKEVFEEAYGLYNDPGFEAYDGWKKESETDTTTVHSRPAAYGKLFALRATLDWDVENVFSEQWGSLDKVSDWNNNINFSTTLKKLTEHIDVVHYANKDVMMVKSRDYIVARIWRKVDGAYYLIARSVDFPGMPEGKDRIRAKINMGAGRFRPHPKNPNQTQVDLMLAIEFGGYIPTYVINTVMAKLIIKDFEETRKHFITLKKELETSQ